MRAILAGFALLALTGCSAPQSESRAAQPPRTRAAADPEGAVERDILKSAAAKPGDEDLGRRYADINTRYFGGVLPLVPVLWEPQLAGVGPVQAPGFSLEGITDGTRILLNPSLKETPDRLTAVLCHEIVHVATRGEKPEHGPAFQSTLRGLLQQGAFTAIWASDAEKSDLRAWLDRESARLDAEDATVQTTRADLDASTTHDEAFGQRVAEFNARLARDAADQAHFNDEAQRYNLMMSYPDGLDAPSTVRPRMAPSARAGQ